MKLKLNVCIFLSLNLKSLTIKAGIVMNPSVFQFTKLLCDERQFCSLKVKSIFFVNLKRFHKKITQRIPGTRFSD